MRRPLPCFLLIVIFLVSICIQSTAALALQDMDQIDADDSCTTTGDNLATKLASLSAEGLAMGSALGIITGGITTILTAPIGAGAGLLSAYIIVEGFEMSGDRNVADCQKETEGNKVTFCYDHIINRIARGDVDNKDCTGDNLVTMASDEEKSVNGATFKVEQEADQVCVKLKGTFSNIKLGCKYRTMPELTEEKPACYVSKACVDNAQNESLGFFPISGVIVQCVKETLENVFLDTSTECTSKGARNNLFISFRDMMRRAIAAALTLYVIFFGMKIALGQEIPSKGEIFLFIIKMVLVIYFSVGDGVRKELYPAFVSASHSFGNMLFTATSSQGLCEYKTEDYTKGFSYLALWDTLDCRIGFYLGLNDPNQAITLTSVFSPAIFTLVLPLLAMFQILPAVFALVFGIFILSISIFVIEVFLISLIGLTVVAYLGPLFVPMALFRATKGYFDAWIKAFFQFTIQPIILFAFLSLIITIVDQAYYGECRFTYKDINVLNDDDSIKKAIPMFYIDGESSHYPGGQDGTAWESCINSFGYQMDRFKKQSDDEKFTTVDAVFFSYTIFKDFDSTFTNLTSQLLKLILFMFLFYYFVNIVADMGADLTGGVPLGRVVSFTPTEIFDKIKAIASKKASAVTGKASKTANNTGKGKKS